MAAAEPAGEAVDAAQPDRSEPAAVPPPVSAGERDDDPEQGSRCGRKLLVALVVVALLAGGAYAAARYTLSNSWYVGVGTSDEVTIYRGIPDDIAGLELREVEESSTIALEDLPEFKRDDIRSGIKTESLEEAQSDPREPRGDGAGIPGAEPQKRL